MPGRDTASPEGMTDRMLRGHLYLADDTELAADHARAQALLVTRDPPAGVVAVGVPATAIRSMEAG